MADDSTVTVRASFSTREAADLAVEHFVQQQGVPGPTSSYSRPRPKTHPVRMHPAETPRTPMGPAMTAPSTATSRSRSTSLRIKSRPFNAFSAMSGR